MYDKICKVCGNSFQAVNSNYVVCSEECRKKRTREQNRERNALYYKSAIGKYKHKQYNREHYVYANKHCAKCGDLLTDGRQSYCLDCLLRDYLYNNTAATRQRLYNRGYDTEMILSEIEERGIV